MADRTFSSDGKIATHPIASRTDTNGATPCWRLIPGDAATCPGQQQVQVDRGPGMGAPPDTNVAVTCAVRSGGATDPALCP